MWVPLRPGLAAQTDDVCVHMSGKGRGLKASPVPSEADSEWILESKKELGEVSEAEEVVEPQPSKKAEKRSSASSRLSKQLTKR